MKIYRCTFAVTAAIAMCCAFAGCSNNYFSANPITARSGFPGAINQAKKDNWQMMLHSGVNQYSITTVEVDKAKKNFIVQLDQLDSMHRLQATNPDAGRTQNANGATAALRQMHVHMRDSTSYTLDEPHTIPLDKVARIERVN